MWPAVDRTGPLGLAVSGGPDSIALLLLASQALPDEIVVASVDHGLRSESATEVALVEALCSELAIPFTGLSVEVAPGNLQARAREARYAALAQWGSELDIGALATAHHADDQAETLLMRLARGSGLAGLAGVRAATFVPGREEMMLVRPLLNWSKTELAAVVEGMDVDAAIDPSNRDDRFDRVRVRQHLAENAWLDPIALSASAGHLSDAWRAIEWYAQIDWEEMVHEERGGSAYRYYANVPRAIAIETIVRIITQLGGLASRGDAARAFDRLWHEQNASLGGVLIRPDTELIEKTGVTMRVWWFEPEPPRTTH